MGQALLQVICNQAHHSCVVSKLDDSVGVESGYTVVCVQGVQQGSQNAVLRSSSVKDENG